MIHIHVYINTCIYIVLEYIFQIRYAFTHTYLYIHMFYRCIEYVEYTHSHIYIYICMYIHAIMCTCLVYTLHAIYMFLCGSLLKFHASALRQDLPPAPSARSQPGREVHRQGLHPQGRRGVLGLPGWSRMAAPVLRAATVRTK